ncbi:LysR family transcriptional regulator [Aureibacillus halotolerans]|uniref:DNA-binding transcriptional LysR family regulator n=1 Tax=Aureibacillus halotolerans TaxID=1508390 RepID=A0A4R6TU61_9BACI|nr:LysR family transcriptional regulator [Aureibacillus halotolerans]TDQ33723.1 DNA-binding transcriptional LysR family regulator [Aureibacillus halotolerans]
MELRQLEYFVAICEELHFSKAAEKLYVSQPNLSQQIKLLENELGVPLFNRIGRRITITEAGQLLYNHSKQILSHISQAQVSISELKQMKGGSLTIGILPGDADLMFNALLLDFHHKYPDVTLSLVETMSVTERVINGTFDIGVTIAPISDERLVHQSLFYEEFSLAVANKSPLARKKAVQLRDLQEEKLVLFPSEHQCRKLIDDASSRLGFRLKPVIETTTLSSMLSLVENNVGATVLPKLLLENLHHEGIETVPITDPTPGQDICLIYRSDKYLGFAARTFITAIKEYIEAAKQKAVTS